MSAPPQRHDPPQDQLDHLVALFNQREMAQVESVGAALARQFPSSALVWKVLGTARLMTAQGDAVAALRRAAELAPKDPDLQANLGSALRGQGQLAEAEQHLRRSIKLNPNSPTALASLGNVLRQQRRPVEAIAAYSAALQLQPQLAGARQNLGVLLASRGELAQAESQYRQALAAQPDLLDSWVNLATLLQDMGRVRDAQDVLSQGLQAVKAGHWMLAALAITGCWMLRDGAGAAKLFGAFQGQVSAEDRALREFFWISARLFENTQREPALYAQGDAAPLVVIGESHCLVPAHAVFAWVDGPVRAQPRLVQGVKMHHLAAKELNGWQAAIRAQLRAIERGSHLMFTIGEIDCRSDEGIWKAHKGGKGALAWLVRNTVGGYLEWLATSVAGGAWKSVTVQGVPRPKRVPEADGDAFLAMVADVNAKLREGCAARGWNFLDVYAATVDAAGAWHLDEFHVRPALYARAMEWLRRA